MASAEVSLHVHTEYVYIFSRCGHVPLKNIRSKSLKEIVEVQQMVHSSHNVNCQTINLSSDTVLNHILVE